MIKKILLLCIIVFSCTDSSKENQNDFTTIFEKSDGLETATYAQTIQFYTDLAAAFPEISIRAIGETDSGKPLHIVTLNMNETGYNFEKLKDDHIILLINNGIHPGESDGIDATMMLFRDFAQGKIAAPKHTVLVTIPIYNVGGSLNRNSDTRTNQNGPEAYGFRGNARNFDLNRDFIKSDTKNAQTFAEIFHEVQPDIFIDNHVSNGADYQYTLTHLFTQHNKLGGVLGKYLHERMMPSLEQNLTDKSWDITPYVNVFNTTPETGFSQFMDSPRYSTGYTTLFNTLGMMVETHMLKPYKQRVEGTYELMKSMIDIAENDKTTIKELRKKQAKIWSVGKTYPLSWVVDSTAFSTLKFKGFKGEQIESDVTGQNRLKYNRNAPIQNNVKYQNYFVPQSAVVIPKAYVIPQGLHHVLELLKRNKVETKTINSDTTIQVSAYKIVDFKTRMAAYEGHYPHYNTTVSASEKTLYFYKGDVIVDTNQSAIRYLLETLEPAAVDSFFNWNFFDTILQQKEGFSPYVWEDVAAQLLNDNPSLKAEFETKKKNDKAFETNWYAQLDWLHKQSNHYEKAHLRYPIYRIE